MSKAAELAALIGSQTALSNRNLIINGAMQVAQRATSSTGQTSSGYKTVDRFRADHGGFTGSYTQDTDVPSGYGFSNSYKVEVTTAASSDAGTLRIDQRVEAQNLRNSGWDYTNSSSYITFSCWVKSSLAGTYYVVLYLDDGTAKQYTKSFTVTANTWEKLEISILGDSGLTINNDNGLGALLHIFVDDTTSSTDNGTTLNGWQTYSSSSRTPDFSQKWTETLNATFHTTGWQLEVGEQATPFEHRSYGDELARCQRYYYDPDFIYAGMVVAVRTTSFPKVMVTFPVTMRATPSVSYAGSNTGTANQIEWSNGATTGATSWGVFAGGLTYVHTTSSIAGGVDGQFRYQVDAEL